MILKTTYPENSILHYYFKRYDYVYSIQGVLIDLDNKIKSDDLGRAFFSDEPNWIIKFVTLRNKIVSIFGLKNSDKPCNKQKRHKKFKCKQGEQIGFFRVFNLTDKEVVLGIDEKHLNFRISLLLVHQRRNYKKKDVTITTIVKFNNWFGRFYFYLIRPFHSRIVPVILKDVIEELEKRN